MAVLTVAIITRMAPVSRDPVGSGVQGGRRPRMGLPGCSGAPVFAILLLGVVQVPDQRFGTDGGGVYRSHGD